MKAGWIGFPREGEDFWSGVEAYAKIGYKGMECGEALLGDGKDDENIARFKALGLEVLTTSTSLEELDKNIDQVINRAKKLSTKRATLWSGNAMGFWYNKPPTKADFLKEVAAMEKAGAELAKEGIQLCYHNHDAEFKLCYDHVMAMDCMLQSSENIWVELDIAWALYGGVDPAALLRRYTDRLGAVHMKDYTQETRIYDGGEIPVTIPVFTAIGTGVVDVLGILQCLDELQHEWVIYEQDALRNLSGTESMTLSYLYMKESGRVE